LINFAKLYIAKVASNSGLTGFDSRANGYVSMQAHATTALTEVAKYRRRKQLRSCCL